ncbi:MAG TPA: L-threonylcarbamoyladenylate synthase [Acidimicrobiales bacterium]|nr:L-threonylcarbamoyladenylate synthase [Acidimicrobiales bacterium]
MSAVVSRDEAVRLLNEGGVVAVPTDTVYGLAASLGRPDAIAKIFSLKHRPSGVALPILVASTSSLEALGVTWPPVARTLSDAFWPGALTIVVDVPAALARRVGSALDTAGFRLPDDELLREVLALTGPLAVSSANEHARLPCHSAHEVLGVFGESETLDGVLDGGTRVGDVSTVVHVVENEWRVLRSGVIHADDVARALE